MDRPGKELLPSPGFSQEKDIRLAAAGLGQQVKAGLEQRAFSDDPLAVEYQAPAGGLLFFPVLKGPLEDQPEVFEGQGFLDVIPGSVFDGQLGAVGIAEARDDDDFGRVGAFLDFGQKIQARAVRQPDIAENDVVARALEQLPRLGFRGRTEPLMAQLLDGTEEGLRDQRIVVDNEDYRQGRATPFGRGWAVYDLYNTLDIACQ